MNPHYPLVHKRVVMIAGPNGAGKTTFATTFLVGTSRALRFINADIIAHNLSPSAPEEVATQAGRVMLTQVDQATEQGESFAIETTLAGRAYLRRIEEWKALGYEVHLYFLKLPTAAVARARVAARVRQGGHHIPPDVIDRRFYAGWYNLHTHYQPVVTRWLIYDNTTWQPVLLDWGLNP